jgi:hypothetical protein
MIFQGQPYMETSVQSLWTCFSFGDGDDDGDERFPTSIL